MKRRSLLRGGLAALIAVPVTTDARPASRLPTSLLLRADEVIR